MKIINLKVGKKKMKVKKVQMPFGFMDVVLFHSGHQHVWARVVRTRILI